MLRFRPIAPKPATRASGSSDPLPKKITKRKYGARAKNNNNNNNNINSESNYEYLLDPTATVTLQLFPNHTTDSESRQEREQSDPTVERLPVSMDFTDNHSTVEFCSMDQTDPTVTESLVTVESVTDVCTIGGIGLGNTDEERLKTLELDTCPGFVSDGCNKVRWINHAYNQMMCTKNGSSVTLALKPELPVEYPAFACVLRVQMQDTRSEMGPTMSSRVFPCDVWRMDFGGFAWRLDLGAALSLGR